jgi:hypothetical protein
MKRKIFLIAGVILLSLDSTSAHALFGSECRKPKQSLEAIERQVSSLSIKYANEVRQYQAARRAEIARWKNVDCFNPTALAKANKLNQSSFDDFQCAFAKSTYVGTPIFSQQAQLVRAKAIRDQLLVTYPKCFDPTKVAEAKIALNQ